MSCCAKHSVTSLKELFTKNSSSPTYLSKEALMNFDKETIIKFLYCADPRAFTKAFSPYFNVSNGLTEEDLTTLVSLWESGKDIEADLDIDKILSDIRVNVPQLTRCSIIFE